MTINNITVVNNVEISGNHNCHIGDTVTAAAPAQSANTQQVALRIKRRIEQMGFTQDHVCSLAGINKRALQSCFLGKRVLKASEMLDLCQVLGMTLSDLR